VQIERYEMIKLIFPAILFTVASGAAARSAMDGTWKAIPFFLGSTLLFLIGMMIATGDV
jgi:hypothetical protein